MRTITFGPKDLRRLFPELEEKEELTLIPLVNTIFWRFWEEIEKFLAKYEITDMMNLDDRRFIVVLNGNLILIRITLGDIDVSDKNKPWWRIRRFSLQGHDEKTVAKFLSFLEAFLQQQGLDKLISSTEFNLHERGIHHLSQETRNFYFGSGGTLHL